MSDRGYPDFIDPFATPPRTTAPVPPRGTGATPAVRARSRSDGRRYPGEAGLWVLIAEDVTVFSVVFAAFLVNRGHDPAQFAASREELLLTVGGINTLVLLTSSLLVAGAVHAYRSGAVTRARRLTVGAAGLGVVFAILKAYEWRHSLDAGLEPSTNDFFMFYYALTGVHYLHVVIGLVLLAFVWRRMRRDPGGESRAFVEGGAAFWHMVDALWIVLFALLYLVST